MTVAKKKKMKNINLIGDITDDVFKRFHVLVSQAEHKNVSKLQVTLMSHGGDSMAALAIFDRMVLSPIEFTVVATGLVASAATIILVAGDKRFMTPSAWFMVHEEQTEDIQSANVTQLEQNAKNYRRLEKQWVRILAHNSRLSEDVLTEMQRLDTYLSPLECKEHGIIDEILNV